MTNPLTRPHQGPAGRAPGPRAGAPRRPRRRWWVLAACALLVTGGAPTAFGQAPAHQGPPHGFGAGSWVNAWQGSPEEGSTTDPTTCPSDTGLSDQTVRNVVPVSTGGGQVRVRISNAFGAAPLRVGAASVSLAATGSLGAQAPSSLRFAGRPSILVAAGGQALSDPVALRVAPLQRLDVDVYLPEATGPATQHFNAIGTNAIASGNHAGDEAATAFTTPITCWLFASGIDVRPSPRVVGTVVALGDSITDGFQSTPDADQRYTDALARRLATLRGPSLAVSNAGIGGNEVLTDHQPGLAGVSALARLERDVLAQSDARSVIVNEGLNDIAVESAQAPDLIQAYEQIIAQAHAAGLQVYAGTLTPFAGSNAGYGADFGTAAGEAQRQAVNRWIRTSGAFDGVFDFDAALRDPADPTRLLPAYDSGDHLHPSDSGYRAMARAVDLRTLVIGAFKAW